VEKDVSEMLRAINRAVLEDELDLTDWEQSFVDAISLRIQGGLPLSEKQDRVLLDLWERTRQ